MPRQLILAAALACLGFPALAGPVVDSATEAEKALAAKDYDAAVAAIRKAQDIVWNEMPLTVRNVTIVDSATGLGVDSATGLGVYKPRGNDTFKKSEELGIYAEVEGYAMGEDGLGNNLLALEVGVTLKNPEGTALGSESNLGTIRLTTRRYNREMFAKIDLQLESLPAGKYVGAFTMKDANSKKTARFEMPFEVTD